MNSRVKVSKWSVRILGNKLTKLARIWKLLLAVLIWISLLLAIDVYFGSPVISGLLFPTANADGSPSIQWKDYFQVAIFSSGLAAALMLWAWRDANVQEQVNNQRKDINLREFQEVQLRAVGAIDMNFPWTARETLQVAALHQLRAFLRGDYGEELKRPAFETFCSLLSRANHEDWEDNEEDLSTVPGEIFRTIRTIVAEEWQAFFWSDFPLSKRSLAQLQLTHAFPSYSKKPLQAYSTNLQNLSAVGSCFEAAYLAEADLSDSHLALSSFASANLERANLSRASAQSSDFRDANLKSAILRSAKFNKANLSNAKAERTDFFQSSLRLADCTGMQANDATFVDANLSCANLRNAVLAADDLTIEMLGLGESSKFSRADFSDCYAEGADLRGINPDSLLSCFGMYISRETKFSHPTKPPFADLGGDEWEEAAKLWTKRGAIIVEEPPLWPPENASE